MSFYRYLMLLFCVCLSGCAEMGYYSQAVKGQWQIFSQREEIATLLESDDLEESRRQQLNLVRQIRDFASSELGLPENMSYRYFTETGKKYVVWNVVATPEFDLSPKSWCFPIAGCTSYKGYFSKADAEELERDLNLQGYDTFLYGVSAYSTLGWFADPVLDTFVNYREDALAELIFHELAHQVVYVPDDSAFNEAFATTVANRGLELWTASRGLDVVSNSDAGENERNAQITAMVLRFRDRLKQLYADPGLPDMAGTKHQVFDDMKRSYSDMQNQGLGTPWYDWWFSLELNNAHMTSIATYYNLVPAFESLLQQSGSLESFYREVENHADLPQDERDAWLLGYLSGTR